MLQDLANDSGFVALKRAAEDSLENIDCWLRGKSRPACKRFQCRYTAGGDQNEAMGANDLHTF